MASDKLKENPLKFTISGNLFAFIGWFAMSKYIQLYFDYDYIQKLNEAGSFDLALDQITTKVIFCLIFSALLFLLEYMLGFKIESKFLKDNIIYNTLFYIGFWFNILFPLVCMASYIISKS